MGFGVQDILIRPFSFPEDYDEVYALWEKNWRWDTPPHF